ncbi:MAG: DUF937 domain-containing protein [Betaproteobacteria bacterium]|nr:DUF937 domain-containing protein [Betaproteobacteria bacterium]
MGLLDSLLGSLSQSGAGSGSGNELLDMVLKLVNDPAHGGLSGLVQSFQDKGLGGIVDSWVSTGQNMPISADQLSQGLGSDKLGSLAQSLGMDQGDLSSKLSELLPNVVDKLTPGGQVPQGGELGDLLASVTKRLG